MAEKMKEIVSLTDSLDDLDKAAWLEIVGCAERETEDKLSAEIKEGHEAGLRVWREIFPFVQMIRLGLASDTLSKSERCSLVSAVLSTISGLLSPVELAGVCSTIAFKSLHDAQRGGITTIAIPLPFGAREFEKKDETKSVV